MVNEYNRKRIHPPFYQHDYHVLHRLYGTLEKIAKQYFPTPKGVLVDYGCGSTPYKELFLPYVNSYTGVDIGNNRQADILTAENTKIPLAGKSVDIILSTQVLEHVDKSNFYFAEARRLLKNSGLLLLSTHGVWPYHPYPTDYHRWTRSGLENALKEHGFKCLKIVSILGPFACITQFTLLLIAERLINKGFFSKILLSIFSLTGNSIIWLEDKLFPPTATSDASLYVICAKKN